MQLFKTKKDNKPIMVRSVKEPSWHRVSRDPFVDWVFMLLVALCIVAIMAIFAVSAYVDVGVSMTYGSDQGASKSKNIIDTAQLESFVSSIDRRIKNSTSIKNSGFMGTRIPADPSK